jgi:hypothetical protein
MGKNQVLYLRMYDSLALRRRTPLKPVELNAGRFPTASMMNEGTGMLEERESRLIQRVTPMTAAFISPLQQEYADLDASAWLGTPQDAERSLAKMRSVQIPNDYLQRFQLFLYQIHMYGFASYLSSTEHLTTKEFTPQHEFRSISDVAYIKYAFTEGQTLSFRRLTLEEIYVRPCGEGFGFMRIILYEMLRACVFFQCDFSVSDPFQGTRSALDKYVPFPYLLDEEGDRTYLLADLHLALKIDSLRVTPLLLRAPPDIVVPHFATVSVDFQRGDSERIVDLIRRFCSIRAEEEEWFEDTGKFVNSLMTWVNRDARTIYMAEPHMLLFHARYDARFHILPDGRCVIIGMDEQNLWKTPPLSFMVKQFLDHMLKLRIENIDDTTLYLYFELFYPVHASSHARAEIVRALDSASHPALQPLGNGRYTITSDNHEERTVRQGVKRLMRGFISPVQDDGPKRRMPALGENKPP